VRKIAVCLVLILLASNLWAQSVTISQEKLDELMGILQTYMQETEKLSASLTSSEAQISDLQTGFAAYKQEVETVLIPKAKAQETTIVWMEWGMAALAAALAGVTIYAVLK
jgi:cell division protein FtsB